MTDDVELKVTFCVKTPDTAGESGSGMITHTINFGEQLKAKNVEWKAGIFRSGKSAGRLFDFFVCDKSLHL